MLKEPRYRVKQLEYCNKQMFGNLIVTCPTYANRQQKEVILPVPITVKPVAASEEIIRRHLMMDAEKRKTSILVDQLLMDIHSTIQHSTDYNSTTSGRSSQQKYTRSQSHDLFKRDPDDLAALVVLLSGQIERVGVKLVRRLKRREALRRQQEAHCDVITCQLKKLLPNSTEDMCFTVDPQHGESGFAQWVAAMKMVAQLPGGIPPEFRRRLWLTMAEKHLASKGVDWLRVERTCFSEWSHPDDGELGVQIVKDLHRTGCSLFCGEGGQENQALLKKVLLAYARWNKAVGYCQGFNMLAALILQVTDKSETDALKLMIYLIEGVLPESYFADSLRGLSVDMAVFRELLRTRLPKLSKHLDLLQNMAKEGTTSYEPPLTNVFTMQWFLTLFCNCLPQPSVLRVWDLILLEGNEILLRTALAIWQALADRILRVRTADEFYCIMGVLTTELLENNLVDANSLIKAVVTIGPLTELKNLREHYLYNINPWGAMPSPLELAEKQLKLYPKERLALDISTLKKQYLKLRQRQRQAHIIFTAAISKQPPPRAPVAMNHLLLGKSALVPAKRIGPPKGSIPPARVPTTLQWKDAKQPSSSSSSDTELCDEENQQSDASDDSSQQKTPCGEELPEDNPLQSDNPNVIKDDLLEEESTENVIVSNSDSIEPLVETNSGTFVEKTLDNDSEDDSVDFELFLAGRVKCLKSDVLTDDERVGLSRRNSERALQIIQENSLILHRILQCQSRLSPPMTETEIDTDDDAFSRKSLDSCRHAGDGMLSPSGSSSDKTAKYPKDCFSFVADDEVFQDLSNVPLQKPPEDDVVIDDVSEYRSKYSDILEKSRNLNEKYNDLILHSNKTAIDNDSMKNSSSNDNFKKELIDFDSDLLSDKTQNISEIIKLEDDESTSLFDIGNFSQIESDQNHFDGTQLIDTIEKTAFNENGSSVQSRVMSHSFSNIPLKTEGTPIVGEQEFEVTYNYGVKLKSEDSDFDESSSFIAAFPPNFSSGNNHSVEIEPFSNEISSTPRSDENSITEINKHTINSYNRFEILGEYSFNSGANRKSEVANLEEKNENTLLIAQKPFSSINISISAPYSEDEPSSEQMKDVLSDGVSVSSKMNFSDFNISPSKSTSSTSSFTSPKDFFLDSSNRKCLSATNSIEKPEILAHKRSLSATNSIERNNSSSNNISGGIIEPRKELPSILSRADSIELNSDFWSPTRSRFSSSSSRDIKSPISEKSTTSSRMNSPSPDRSSGVFKRYSPNYLDDSERDGEDKKNVSSDSAIKNFENERLSSTKKGTGLDGISAGSHYRSYMEAQSPTYERFKRKEIDITEKKRISCQTSSEEFDSHSNQNVSSKSEEFGLKAKTANFSSSKKSVCPTDHSEIFTSGHSSDKTMDFSKIKSTSTNEDIFRITSPTAENRKYATATRDDEDDFRSSRSSLSDYGGFSRLTSPGRNLNFESSRRLSPSLRDKRDCNDSSPKSPNRIFNPFPVPLSSRQSKDVGVKLGLYKK